MTSVEAEQDQQNADPFLVNPAKEAPLRDLCAKTGYSLTQENGQRKYGGPPPGWNNDPVPGKGCEIFVGKLPRDLYEDELVPVLEKCGRIFELRLMMDFNGNNRGFAFVKYCVQNDARRALKELNNFEIRKGRLLGVCKSVDNCRLFVGGIPKTKQKHEILVEMKKLTEGVVDVIVYPSALDKSKNRGFAFVEYQDHHTAAMARRKLMHSRPQVWGHPIAVDWAEPEVEVDEDIMATVKILYIRNLMLNTTEESLEKEFLNIVDQSSIERVKKIRDYAFVHLNTRENALKCLKALNGKLLDGVPMEVTLAKPVDRETYVRYTRAANRQVTEANTVTEQLSAYPIVTYDPNTAMYSTYPNTPLFYSAIPQTAQPVGLQPGLTIPGIAQIGAAGVPLGIPGATSGIPATRTLSARGRFRPTGTNRTFAGRGYLNLGRGYPTTYYNRRPMWQMYPPTQVVQPESPVRAEKYDLLPGMELIPINQLYIKHNNLPKSSVQLLEELCAKKQIGIPEYSLHSVAGKNGRPLFLYRVSLPGSEPSNSPPDQQSDSPRYNNQPQLLPDSKEQQQSNNSPQQFTPTKLSTSLDAAKEIAAEYVFQFLDSDDNTSSPNAENDIDNTNAIQNSNDVQNAVYVAPPTVPIPNITAPNVVYGGQTYFTNGNLDPDNYNNFYTNAGIGHEYNGRTVLAANHANYENY